MSKQLEKFIRENKPAFDQHEPPANLWAAIETQLDEQKRASGKERMIKLSLVLKIAAIFIVVLCAGIIFWQHGQGQPADVATISPELNKQQLHYTSLIESKQAELKRIEKEDPHLYNEFSEEISRMEQNYQSLKSDLPTSPNQEETVKAMIRNLQTQIEVLNQQLIIIKQINQLKEEKDETQSI